MHAHIHGHTCLRHTRTHTRSNATVVTGFCSSFPLAEFLFPLFSVPLVNILRRRLKKKKKKKRLATEQVLIFGAVLTFGGYDKAEAKILQGRSLFNPMLSAHNTLLCMFQRLCTYFQYTGVLIFGGYVLSGHCNQQQISVKTEGYLFSEGYLFTGFYGSPSAQVQKSAPFRSHAATIGKQDYR